MILPKPQTPTSTDEFVVPVRDPAWPLPDRPDHPAYTELLDAIERGSEAEGVELFRQACVNDFWFFNRYCLSVGELLCNDGYLKDWHKKNWLDHPWLFDRCREIQAEPDGCLDLWPRYYFKTTLITQSLTLWDFLVNPELRVGIGTYKLDDTGEAMSSQIKNECQKNEKLRSHFPATFFWDPEKESPLWTATKMTFRRKMNPKEPSISAFGVISGLLTSMHFDVLVIDDLVVEKSVQTRNAIEATTEAWRRTAGLGADDTRRRMVGTHWASGDSYKFILDIGGAKLRYHDVFGPDGETPQLRSREWVYGDGTSNNPGMLRIMGARNFAIQMRNRPELAGNGTFDPAWLKHYDHDAVSVAAKGRTFMFVDAAQSKKDSADFTTIGVVSVHRGVPWPHYFVLDLWRDRMNLAETTELIFELAEKWRPTWTFYERVAHQRDLEHIKMEMVSRGLQFRIMEMAERVPKESRIMRLQLPFERGQLWLPHHVVHLSEGRPTDLIEIFKRDEYACWTIDGTGAEHDDMLDVLSWPFSPTLKRYVRPPDRVTETAQYSDSFHQRDARPRRGLSSGRMRAWAN